MRACAERHLNGAIAARERTCAGDVGAVPAIRVVRAGATRSTATAVTAAADGTAAVRHLGRAHGLGDDFDSEVLDLRHGRSFTSCGHGGTKSLLRQEAEIITHH